MGNFRILTDNVSKTVEFIQVDKFLTTEKEDWTDKIDHSKPHTIEHIQNIGAKQLEYSYSNDSDDLIIKDYSDRFDEVWARKRVDLDSEYRKGKQTIFNSIFSSTIDSSISLEGLRTPVMSKKEPTSLGVIDTADIEYETNFENRILIYGGLQPGAFTFDDEYQTEYPYAYFTSEEFSLNWRTQSELLSGGSLGLVDRYWQSTLNRQNNARVASFWMNLNELDISSLSFRKVKVVDGVHYYLNLVNDYKVNANQPTRVELISR